MDALDLCVERCPPHRFWIKPFSEQAESPGVCLRCGETRTFSNVLPESRAFRFSGPGDRFEAIAWSESVHADDRRRELAGYGMHEEAE